LIRPDICRQIVNSAGSSPNEARHVRFAQRTAVSAIAGQPEPDPATLHERITDANFAQPIFYIGNRFNVVGQDAKIEWPDCPRWLDYEGDSGGFIGRKDRNISSASPYSTTFPRATGRRARDRLPFHERDAVFRRVPRLRAAAARWKAAAGWRPACPMPWAISPASMPSGPRPRRTACGSFHVRDALGPQALQAQPRNRLIIS